MSGRRSTWLVIAAFAGTTLLFIPGLSRAFFTPKLWVFAAAAALGACALPRLRATGALPRAAGALLPLWLAASWALGPASTAPAAVLDLSGAVSLWLWPLLRVDRRLLARAVALTGGLLATVALAQGLGADPFAAFAPVVHGRLHRYGTLGNPDFVAGVLASTLLVSCGQAFGARGAARAGFAALCALQLAALVATRSWGSVLALAAAALVLAARHRRGLLFLLPAVAAAALGARGRDLPTAARGRLYLLRVAAPHLADAPLFGGGPGSTAALWPLWEAELWTRRCGDDPACVQRHPDRVFAALQDHVHDDLVERALETGLPGAALLGAALFLLLRRALDAPADAWTAGALTALLARALIDFPLARPEGLCLLSTLAALTSEDSR